MLISDYTFDLKIFKQSYFVNTVLNIWSFSIFQTNWIQVIKHLNSAININIYLIK